jgi:hypothetical protein
MLLRKSSIVAGGQVDDEELVMVISSGMDSG